MLAQLTPLGILLLAFGSLAVTINLVVRLIAWIADRRIQTVDDLEIPITEADPLSPDDLIGDEQCNRCGALQMRGSTPMRCWNCKSMLASAVVDAGHNPNEAA